MQLVNIDTPQDYISNDLIEAIQSKQIDNAKKILANIDNHETIIRSFYLLSCRQISINNYLNSAIVYTNAISELVKRLFPEDPQVILEAALDYYCSINYSTDSQNFPVLSPEETNKPVVVADLPEAIKSKNIPEAYKICKRLLTVVESKNYFNELFLEIATKNYTESGEGIILINSIMKAIELYDWQMIDELFWYAINFLTSEKYTDIQKPLTPSSKDIRYAEYVLKAASDPGDHGINLLFMGHARQIYRSANVKRKEIWSNLSSFIQTKLDKIRIAEMDEIEPVKGDIVDFEKSIDIKDVKLSMTFVNEILHAGIDDSELFGTITLYILHNNKFKIPELIIYLNMARRLSTALDYPRNLFVFNCFLAYLYQEDLSN